MVLICPSTPFRERVKVSHVIVGYRVINHHSDHISAITKAASYQNVKRQVTCDRVIIRSIRGLSLKSIHHAFF